MHTRAPIEIRPTGLGPEQIEQYIRLAQRSADAHEGPLDPFTAEAVEELFKITHGQPRLMIMICHHAYRVSQGVLPIGPQQIKAAARELTAHTGPGEICEQLDRFCTELGFHTERVAGEEFPEIMVRSRVGGRDVAIVISPPVLDDDKIPALAAQAARLSRTGDRTVFLVVAGLLSGALRNGLEKHFSAVLQWGWDDLHARLATLLRANLSEHGQTAMYDLLMELRQEVRGLREGAADAPRPPTDAEPRIVDPVRAEVYRKAMAICQEALDGIHQIRRTGDEFWRERFSFHGRTTFVFPEPSEDPSGRIVELLGVDKAVLMSHVGRLGTAVYSTVRLARLGE